MNKKILVAATAVVLIAVFALAANFYNSNKTAEIDASAKQHASVLVREHSPAKGDNNARVTIVEFFDPACETCKNFHPFVQQLMAANPGRIKLVMRYTPLHNGSDDVVKILEASRLQNRFWETLDLTYDSQSSWTIHHSANAQKLWQILTNTGLDMERLKQDALSPEVAQRIQQDIADAMQLQVDKTPGFFVNGKPLIQFGYEQLQTLVESEIRKVYQ